MSFADPDDQKRPDWHDELASLTGARLTHRTGGGDWFSIVRYGDRRAALYGFSRDSNPVFLESSPPPDLLADCPAWALTAETSAQVLRDELSFFCWQEGDQAHWNTADEQYGWDYLVSIFADVEQFLLELVDFELIETDSANDELRDKPKFAPLVELFEAAKNPQLPEAVLAKAFGSCPAENVVSATQWLAQCGVLTGSTAPCAPEAEPSNTPRSRRRITEEQHLEHIDTLLCATKELERPSVEQSEALRAFLAVLQGAEDFTVMCAVRPGCSSQTGRLPGSLDHRVFSSSLRALWEAERHPKHGGWLYICVSATGGAPRLERIYDHRPSWWNTDVRLDLDRHFFAEEFAARAPQWRPSWTDDLKDEYAWENVPD